MQELQQESIVTEFDHFHPVVTQDGGNNISIPSTSVGINPAGRRPTLSDPIHTRQTSSQSRVTSTGSLRSLPSRETWSSLATLVDIHHTDHLEVGDPDWLSEILNEPAASMFNEDESTLGAHSVGENGL